MKRIILMLLIAGTVHFAATAQVTDTGMKSKTPTKAKLVRSGDTTKAPGMPYDQSKKNPSNSMKRSTTSPMKKSGTTADTSMKH